MPDFTFIPADAHEGCVWVPARQRLYFSSTKQLPAAIVSLRFLDFSGIDAPFDPANHVSVSQLTATVALPDSNMTNSFHLAPDGNHLVCAEQGTPDAAARISKINLDTLESATLADNFRGQPFNSPNKVIRSRRGHLIFSDPDYGFRQGFRPPPELEPNVYVRTAAGELTCFRCGLEMPHGLALTPDERHIFITDTSADGAHDRVSLDHRRRAVFRYDFEATTGQISGDPLYCFHVDEGVPDGTITAGDRLLVGGGDGIYIADLSGNLLRKIELTRTVVNLCTAGAQGEHLFVTADEGVYMIYNWREE